MPSLWWEPLGLVIYEAFSHKKPVIAAHSGGITDHVKDGQTGWLHTPGDVQSLAAHMLEALSHPQECSRRGELGLLHLQHLHPDAWLKAFNAFALNRIHSQPPSSMSHAPRIAAVFATMNRSQTAVSCVNSLAAQSRPPQWVIVADNVSSDSTASDLEALSNLPFDLRVHRMPQNLGNAGGVEAAMKIAFDLGADAVWILDDDSWPRANALKALLAEPLNPHVVRHSLQVDPTSRQFTWPMWIQEKGSWKLISQPDETPTSDLFESKSSWTGALIPKHVFLTVGPVNGDLFIRGEDMEYPWRIENAGFAFEAARNSILDHPGPQHIICWKLLGKRLFFERNLADSKFYYIIRNRVWLKRQQSGYKQAILMTLAYACATIRFDGSQRLPLVWKAACDGWQGRLGPKSF